MIKKIISITSIVFILSGCVQKLNNAELLGAAAGGAVGGAIGSNIGQGLVKLASITAGVLVGGSSGALGARVLQDSDLFLYRKTAANSLSKNLDGDTSNWNNSKTGSAGAFRPMTTYTLANGQVCRGFRTTIVFSDGIESGSGAACKQLNGLWKIVSDDFS